MEERIAALERANRRMGWAFGVLIVALFGMNLLSTLELRSIDCYSLTVRGGSIRIVDEDRRPLVYLGPDGQACGMLNLTDASTLRSVGSLGADVVHIIP